MSSKACASFLEDLAAVVDGDEAVLDLHLDHVSDCDECRDARHDAARAAKLVGEAGADYQAPEDLSARVLAALDAEVPAAPVPVAQPEPLGQPVVSPPRKSRSRRNVIYLFAAAAVSVIVGGAVMRLGGGKQAATVDERAPGATAGKLVRIDRAADDGASGLTLKVAGASDFAPARVGADIPAGATVRTDSRTRVRIELADGTELTLNHGTELTLDPAAQRSIVLSAGELVADVADVKGAPPASFTTTTGRVEAVGTFFVLSAAKDFTSVRVTRGLVRLHGVAASVEVRPGEEGTLRRGAKPQVDPAVDLAGAVAWSELDNRDAGVEPSMAGIGELRAYRPGEKRDKDWKLSLSRHKVTVRIVGNVARTEIE